MIYRAPNRRIQQRATSGRFRETTLADVGLAHCPTCGAIFAPEEDDGDGPVDPRLYRERRRACAECRSKEKA